MDNGGAKYSLSDISLNHDTHFYDTFRHHRVLPPPLEKLKKIALLPWPVNKMGPGMEFKLGETL